MSEIKYEINTKLVLNRAIFTLNAILYASPRPVCTRKCSKERKIKAIFFRRTNQMINVSAQFEVLTSFHTLLLTFFCRFYFYLEYNVRIDLVFHS